MNMNKGFKSEHRHQLANYYFFGAAEILSAIKYCRPSNTVGHRFTEIYLKRTIFDDTAISNVNELVVGNKIGTVTEKMS